MPAVVTKWTWRLSTSSSHGGDAVGGAPSSSEPARSDNSTATAGLTPTTPAYCALRACPSHGNYRRCEGLPCLDRRYCRPSSSTSLTCTQGPHRSWRLTTDRGLQSPLPGVAASLPPQSRSGWQRVPYHREGAAAHSTHSNVEHDRQPRSLGLTTNSRAAPD